MSSTIIAAITVILIAVLMIPAIMVPNIYADVTRTQNFDGIDGWTCYADDIQCNGPNKYPANIEQSTAYGLPTPSLHVGGDPTAGGAICAEKIITSDWNIEKIDISLDVIGAYIERVQPLVKIGELYGFYPSNENYKWQHSEHTQQIHVSEQNSISIKLCVIDGNRSTVDRNVYYDNVIIKTYEVDPNWVSEQAAANAADEKRLAESEKAAEAEAQAAANAATQAAADAAAEAAANAAATAAAEAAANAAATAAAEAAAAEAAAEAAANSAAEAAASDAAAIQLEKINELNQLGVNLFVQGHLDDSLRVFDQVLQEDPVNIPALTYKGAIFHQKGMNSDAITTFKEILIFKPGHLSALYNIAYIELKSENYPESLTYFKQVSNIDSNFYDTKAYILFVEDLIKEKNAAVKAAEAAAEAAANAAASQAAANAEAEAAANAAASQAAANAAAEAAAEAAANAAAEAAANAAASQAAANAEAEAAAEAAANAAASQAAANAEAEAAAEAAANAAASQAAANAEAEAAAEAAANAATQAAADAASQAAANAAASQAAANAEAEAAAEAAANAAASQAAANAEAEAAAEAAANAATQAAADAASQAAANAEAAAEAAANAATQAAASQAAANVEAAAEATATDYVEISSEIPIEITHGNSKIFDSSSNSLDVDILNNSYIFTKSWKNDQLGTSQSFAYILKITDSEGFVISLSHISGTLGPRQTFEQSLSFQPLSYGTYTITAYVWDDVENPTALTHPESVLIQLDPQKSSNQNSSNNWLEELMP